MSSDAKGLVLNDFITQMQMWTGTNKNAWWIWRLIPVQVEDVRSESLPSYDGDGIGQSSTHTQHAEPERDEFGTIVNEVTVVTTTSTVTTRKRYRVEDA